ncbi:TlyA family RNA methyltransferase [Pediococcus pentosaceus]|jgi:23S rRNA (cytidine1920-2'-O)/16S rRNA (cytidine1409-2'-O)-methyltransferase|uniref:TlyA family RNA methyltransferase n=1 Tax=Pediococcus pentosaceus TaxID=1255 RepID=UPI001919C728|nr:TlyA family RNA methyltransferase [Pediococcus pentosaceus]MCH3989084.1 TlyA family RNA methyltransferase [Pediococcus pentosaceus]MCH4015328.1 TlyA family RNA methyltransferase [Pediococcus pentosaceus]MCH4059296.1 TlyA family RNA methyltransferase [Pediococcus pentosaceus]MCI1396366.1 TlyA family RNA methyltransferase [Pediococcus pentosaceus]MCQ0027979.1 TlyA family RNA methyltransferase [Pediococcus pentosaceus]
MAKERVDVLLVEQGLFDTREKAKRAVMAGEILGDNEERLDKPGVKIDPSVKLHLKGKPMPYVSRGGLKLEKALKVFGLDIKGLTVLDIGSSTGGFTDVMLQNGAKLSYALDVGTNQLVWKLREDPRVVVMENTNFRYSKLEDFTEGQPEFASIDVSFISLKLILPALKNIIKTYGSVVSLIKPQFEAGRENVGKHGIVRDRKVHEEVLKNVLAMANAEGFNVKGLDFSPIKGGEGNIEFLAWLERSDTDQGVIEENVDTQKVIDSAYSNLNS